MKIILAHLNQAYRSTYFDWKFFQVWTIFREQFETKVGDVTFSKVLEMLTMLYDIKKPNLMYGGENTKLLDSETNKFCLLGSRYL